MIICLFGLGYCPKMIVGCSKAPNHHRNQMTSKTTNSTIICPGIQEANKWKKKYCNQIKHTDKLLPQYWAQHFGAIDLLEATPPAPQFGQFLTRGNYKFPQQFFATWILPFVHVFLINVLSSPRLAIRMYAPCFSNCEVRHKKRETLIAGLHHTFFDA